MSAYKHAGRVAICVATVILCAAFVLAVVSCGGTESQPAPADEAKLPPGITEDMLTETTGTGSTAAAGTDGGVGAEPAGQPAEQAATAPENSAELSGARFTVVAATRPDTNADVLKSGQREVEGDYLEVELAVENVGGDLADLSDYSFRIWSPGIRADEYQDYYGMDGYFGKYVSDNIISAVLLDYNTLQPALYKLKIGEKLDGVFLFLDLNPKSTARNEGVIKEETNLVIHKQRGENAGEEVEINLAGYPD